MISNASPLPVVHNLSLKRFETEKDGLLAYAHYAQEGDRVVFDHTYVPAPLRGGGIASALVRAALEEARQRQWRIVPRCSFVAEFIDRHPEFANLVAP